MMVIEEPDYESDFDNESDIADLEEEDDGDEENDIDSGNDNVSTNEQISTEEDNSINKNATTNTTAVLNKNKLNRSIKSSSAGSGNNDNSDRKKKNDKNKQNLNGNTNKNIEIDNEDNESTNSTSSEIESEINDNEDISKRITTEFQGMKMKFHKNDRIHDVEMEYTMRQRISNSQKYIGSSTDTNNDENVQRTFQVEVLIENQRFDSDTEESKQRTEQKVGNSTKEDTSADELSEDSSEEEANDNEDEESNNDNKNNQNENENESVDDDEEEDEEDDGEDENENEDKNENDNDNEFKVLNDNVKERNDKSDSSLDEKLDQEVNQVNENKNSDLNEINLKAIITDQSGNLIKYSSEKNETIEKSANRKSIDSSISIEISSRRPSSFNSDEYPLRLNCINKRKSTPDLRTKQNLNKNLSFSNSRMREIERTNQVLLKKILTQKSTYEAKSKQKKNVKNNTRQTSAAINRKKQQRQIDIDNQVLKRKLEAIAFRNRHH